MLPLKNSSGRGLPLERARPKARTSQKMIFLALEGAVSEEEYFRRIAEIFSAVRSKIQFLSVTHEIAEIPPSLRSPEQKRVLSRVRPCQLLRRLEVFRREKDAVYQLDLFKDVDEYWIVSDVDENWSRERIPGHPSRKTYVGEWEETVRACRENGYHYAISNPFFEVWLLLHHGDVTEEDSGYAVTDSHPYERTDHFKKRLARLNAPLRGRGGKHIAPEDYHAGNVREAIRRAKALHLDRDDDFPRYLATTVYRLLEKIQSLL